MADTGRAQLIRVGLFSIAGVLVFAVLVFMFKPAVRFLRGGYRVKVHLTYAGEIRKGTPVRYLGIDAGEVMSVDYAPPEDEEGGVIVTLLLRPDANLRDDPEAPPYVDTKFTGEAYIEFPQPDPAAPLLRHGATIKGRYRPTAPDLIAQLAGLAGSAEATVLEVKGAVSHLRDGIDTVGAAFREVSQNAARLLENADALVGDKQVQQDVKEGVAALRSAGQRADKVLKDLEPLLGDQKLHQDVRETVAAMRTTGDRMAAAADDLQEAARKVRAVADRGDTLAAKLERTLDQQNANLDRVARSIVDAAEGLSGVLAASQRILTAAAEGKGTVGRLLNDPALFEDLLKTVAQIERAAHGAAFLVEDLREHPGDYIRFGLRSTSDEERTEREKEPTQPTP